MPSVLICELVIAFLVRARSTVRLSRAVSWRDVAGITLWHGLTIAVGFFPNAFGWILTAAIAGFLVVFWSSFWQLGRESASALQRAMDPDLSAAAAQGSGTPRRGPVPGTRAAPSDRVIVISESPAPDERR
jgi:hypothetical protein